MYTIKQGDTINTVAARFETTVKKLLMVNPKIAEIAQNPRGTIHPGMDVCILACTDRMAAPPTIMGWGTNT